MPKKNINKQLINKTSKKRIIVALLILLLVIIILLSLMLYVINNNKNKLYFGEYTGEQEMYYDFGSINNDAEKVLLNILLKSNNNNLEIENLLKSLKDSDNIDDQRGFGVSILRLIENDDTFDMEEKLEIKALLIKMIGNTILK